MAQSCQFQESFLKYFPVFSKCSFVFPCQILNKISHIICMQIQMFLHPRLWNLPCCIRSKGTTDKLRITKFKLIHRKEFYKSHENEWTIPPKSLAYFPEIPFYEGDSGNRAQLSPSHTKLLLPSSSHTHDQIRRSKKQIEPT